MVHVYVSSAGLLSSSVHLALTEPCLSLCLSGTLTHACKRTHRCAAWEDGKPTTGSADTVMKLKNGAHTSTKTCAQHWPNGMNASWPADQRTSTNNWYNFSEPQAWCCWSWCYVDRLKCTDEVAAKHGIAPPTKSWTGADIWYSYGACADWGSRPTKPPDQANGQAADLSQFNCTECSEVKGKPGAAEICAQADANKPVLGKGKAAACGEHCTCSDAAGITSMQNTCITHTHRRACTNISRTYTSHTEMYRKRASHACIHAYMHTYVRRTHAHAHMLECIHTGKNSAAAGGASRLILLVAAATAVMVTQVLAAI